MLMNGTPLNAATRYPNPAPVYTSQQALTPMQALTSAESLSTPTSLPPLTLGQVMQETAGILHTGWQQFLQLPLCQWVLGTEAPLQSPDEPLSEIFPNRITALFLPEQSHWLKDMPVASSPKAAPSFSLSSSGSAYLPEPTFGPASPSIFDPKAPKSLYEPIRGGIGLSGLRRAQAKNPKALHTTTLTQMAQEHKLMNQDLNLLASHYFATSEFEVES